MDLGDITHVNIRWLGELLTTITGSHGPGGGDISHVNIRRLGGLLTTITGSHEPGGHNTCEHKETGGTVDHNNRL